MIPILSELHPLSLIKCSRSMNKTFFTLLMLSVIVSCRNSADNETIKNEVLQAEKAFEKMAAEKGLAEAFWFFASEDAVIPRGNDSLIKGKENIKAYYSLNANPDEAVSWTPDFIDVSSCGTLAYTYGRYVYSGKDSLGNPTERTGIFHTVWKKENKTWRYVWD